MRLNWWILSRHWDIGILGYWDIGILGYWDIGILGYWDIGILGYLNIQYLNIQSQLADSKTHKQTTRPNNNFIQPPESNAFMNQSLRFIQVFIRRLQMFIR